MALCAYQVPRKGRTCRARALPGHAYCGNHLALATGSGERIPCPWDSTHHIRKGEEEEHRRRCPFLLQQKALQAQSFCRPGCNAGDQPPARLRGSQPGEAQPLEGSGPRRTAARVAHVRQLGPHGLQELIRRVESAVQQACPAAEPCRHIQPPECQAFFEPNNESPFSLRHAMQQASIVGNARAFGLLQDEAHLTVVELGAGRGYLSLMLGDCTAARRFLLVDNQSFRLKAERQLRKACEVRRARVGIEDFDPAGLPELQQPGAAWLAVGKHLCGAATDFSLRCCARLAAGGGPPARGLAIAPCCHHRCAWEHFVGWQAFAALGFSPEDFEIVSWMTGWALCGHEAPMGSAPEGEAADGGGQPREQRKKKSRKQREAALRERATQILQQQRQAAEAGAAQPGSPAEAAAGQAAEGLASAEGQREAALSKAASEAGAEEGAEDGSLAAGEPTAAETGCEGKARLFVTDIPREARIRVGAACKRLLDHCRAEYLRSCGFRVEVVQYCSAAITGENRLFLAAPQGA